MSEVKIRFHNLEKLLFLQKKENDQELTKDFKSFLLKCHQHKIDILENKHQKLCTYYSENCNYIYNNSRKILQIIDESKEKDNIILEIQSESERIIKEVMNHIEERKQFVKYKGPLAYTPSKLARTSLLSTESPEQDFRGFLNVIGIVVIVTHFSSILESLRDHGLFLENIPEIETLFYSNDSQTFFTIYFSLAVFIFNAYFLQWIFFKRRISSRQSWILNFTNIMALLIIPVIECRRLETKIIPSMIIIMNSIILALKLTSYSHVMRNTYFMLERLIISKNQKKTNLKELINAFELSEENFNFIQKYIDQPTRIIRLKHFFYFLFAPTLCYQLEFPRTPKIRFGWLLKRIVELLIVISLQVYLWYGHLYPVLHETYTTMNKENSWSIPYVIVNFSKMAIPSLYFWLSLFFGFFQVWLNILSEILRFGDRQFYLAWWNCKDLEEYWKLWNLPVHNWFVRHLYNPILKRGFSRMHANFITFFVSAFFHEWIVSCSLGVLGYQAFLAMLLQAPVIFIQKKINKIFGLQKSELGNVGFWVMFCFIGQPLAIFAYYTEYQKIQSN